MAYATKEDKAIILAKIKDAAKELGIKATVTCSIKNLSTFKVNIKSCSIDLCANLIETCENKIASLKESGCYGVREMEELETRLVRNINARTRKESLEFSQHNIEKCFSGQALEFMIKVRDAITFDYSDNSDVYRDYHDVSYYWDLDIGNNANGFIVK